MASNGGRQYAQLLKRIWSDPDWKRLTRDGQWMYELLISQSTINYAGVLPLTVRRWSNLAADATEVIVQAALGELSTARFIVIDWETEEVLVRSFIRNDELWKQPKMLATAIRHADDTSSLVLRWALHDELLRIPEHGSRGRLEGEAAELVAGFERPTPPDTVSDNTLEVGVSTSDTQDHDRPHENPEEPAKPQRATPVGTPTPTHSGTPPQGYTPSQGVGGYVSTEEEAPNTFQLSPAPSARLENSTQERARERENARGPKIPNDGWKLIREAVPNTFPQATKTALALQAGQLLHAGTEPDIVREALKLWMAKPNAGPGLLPHLAADALKAHSRTPKRDAATEKALGWLALAPDLEPGDDPHQPNPLPALKELR